MAEKHRRDSLNTNIVTMGELVPTVADSPRKMDKISIMRLAAAYLRVKYGKWRSLSFVINNPRPRPCALHLWYSSEDVYKEVIKSCL